MTDDVKSGVSPLLLGGGFAAVLIIGALAFLPAPEPEIVETVPIAPQPASTATPPIVEEIVPPEPAESETETADTTPENTEAAEPGPEVVAESPAVPAPRAPEFDTFRVDPDGSMVIAGRAEAGQTVDVMLSGTRIDRVEADSSGSFVALPLASPSSDPRRLTLIADPEGAAIESLTSYIVAPIAAPLIVAEEDLTPVEEPAIPQEDLADVAAVADTATQDEAVIAQTAPSLDETPAAEAVDAPEVATDTAPVPTVLQTDEDGVRIVQGEQTAETDNVALDAITYDPEGDVQLSGRASTDEGAVQVYLDNQPLAAAPIDNEGSWQLDLPEIDTGVYTLRVDEVDAEGTVVSRVETPFKREEPEDVAAVLAEETAQEGFEVAVRTVQPGSSLWAIAEETWGDGILYVEVFEANRDLIRDPDLIYPGQIFRIPALSD
ncbi:LysM peptidoglycan-binding domain-containing protein [Yoonia litorea]|uniref:Nucleoid-associated protein YgaU, contains BON and LysM domains n=1 Tax=Yoonia litorea TaxID=1123755 RepID=A0A1I6LV03_9RHOB|nr:LysM peptidoglycan-binding domain-containing protein [Yoonia litorea]SFS07254.1 Nucleoid-associated protein YgaU, contains BON and LysM domains [Yoonia litorea]